MSKYYGTVTNGRSTANRCGHASTGIQVAARSWHGSVVVSIDQSQGFEQVSRAKGGDWVVISFAGSQSTAAHGRILWEGPLSDLFDADHFLAISREAASERCVCEYCLRCAGDFICPDCKRCTRHEGGHEKNCEGGCKWSGHAEEVCQCGPGQYCVVCEPRLRTVLG